MENRNSFKFQLVDIYPFSKKGDNTKMARIVAYCSYGFLVNLFTTEEKAKKLQEKARLSNRDITEFVCVYFDNKKQNFCYVIDIK